MTGQRVSGKAGIERLLRRDLRAIEPYQPIQPPGSVEGDCATANDEPIKLDGNENVYGPSPRVARALQDLKGCHLYPDPDQRELRTALAAYTGVDSAHIMAGAGSDELIDLLLRLLLEPGEQIITLVPTFGMYSFSAHVCGGQVIDVQRDAVYDIDVEQVLQAITPGTKVIFVASPNNPTGNLTPTQDILRLLESGLLVVVDEAYYEFSGVTMAPLVPEHENLAVLRTFSKWAGLAGLRIGYGIFSPILVRHLMAIKPPYNINIAAQTAALASLADTKYLHDTVQRIVGERERLFDKLAALSSLRPLPSRANFILCYCLRGNARHLQRALRRQGIYIRHFDTPLLHNAVRISVGKPEHTDRVISALKTWEEQQ